MIAGAAREQVAQAAKCQIMFTPEDRGAAPQDAAQLGATTLSRDLTDPNATDGASWPPFPLVQCFKRSILSLPLRSGHPHALPAVLDDTRSSGPNRSLSLSSTLKVRPRPGAPARASQAPRRRQFVFRSGEGRDVSN